MLQWRWHVEPLFDMRPDAFEPPPQVVSSVVRLLHSPQPAAADAKTVGLAQAV
jgi:16S rRNA (adenine1518-N6/adenine1519-N6)-dimethyltransferase